MTISISGPDFSGARGSNTGDQFHELWALQQILDLLDPQTNLKAVGVEGVRTEVPLQNNNDPRWDGVDCALYYGGTTLETADRIDFAQLKYSAANPATVWSVARLTANSAKKGNNSIISKMADVFRNAKERMKPGAQFSIQLVSNQDISAGLRRIIEARPSGEAEDSFAGQVGVADIDLLKTATGLPDPQFQEFLETLDLSRCGSRSRFAVRERVVGTLLDLLGDDVWSDLRGLQAKVRDLMLPERSREVVTEKEILCWLDVSSRESLFPCPPDIRIPARMVERPAADEVVSLLEKGKRLVLVHGVGGCGKTTLMRQITDRLPQGSVTVFFDCFGGGRYEYSDDKRHLPENAFLHLSNELAVALRLPLFIARSNRYPATVKTFLSKLRSAGEALHQISPGGILLVVIDAADNSVVAAQAANPPERPFVHELFGANLSDLPENVRILASCRSDLSRRNSLQLPSNTPEIICPPFSLDESQQHLSFALSHPSDSLVEQFHHLSNANPRVQAYAIAATEGDKNRMFEALLPEGKGLSDVLKASFSNALKKLGQPDIFENLVGALAFLPAPIAVPSIARMANCSEETVRDFTLDLIPGLRLNENTVTIADEDFDDFIKKEAAANRDTVIAKIAQDFLKTFPTDPYSSIHVADALIDAGRARDILSVIEQDPRAAAVRDPILRRQVQIRRLKLSLAACAEAGSTGDALKTVLISAEAEHDDSTLNEVLEKELDLSVEFAGSSLRRAVLLDRDRIKKHGSFLAHDAVKAARSGDRVTAREQLYFYDAWLKRRNKEPEDKARHWDVEDRDVAARTEAILELAGPRVALEDLRRWLPRELSLRVAYVLVPQIIAAGKIHHIKALLEQHRVPMPWDLLLWVAIAMAGEPVDGLAVERSLRHIRRRFVPDAGYSRITYDQNGWQRELLDTFITGCELAFLLKLDNQAVFLAVSRILQVLEGERKRHLFASDSVRIDGLFRCWLLKESISKSTPKDSDFIAYLKTLIPSPKPQKERGGKRQKKNSQVHQTDDKEFEQVSKKIRTLFPVYFARLEILLQAGRNKPITNALLDRLSIGSHVYDFDYDHDSTYLRETLAESVMGLLIIQNISATGLLERASALAQGRFGDIFGRRRKNLWSRIRFRTSESDGLVLLISKTSDDIKRARAASSDKLSAMIDLSRLILPISRGDAEALFNDAIGIAKEIDQEAFDQIDFVSVLAERARIPRQTGRKAIANDIFDFVSETAERLSDREGFPWASAVYSLTCVDDASALAAICRWADEGTVALDNTLDHFLMTALRRDILSPEAVVSLSLLIGGSNGDLRKELVLRAAAEPQKHHALLEELARETLLLAPQSARLSPGEEIVSLVPVNSLHDGKWLGSLRKTVAFLDNTKDNEPEKVATIRPETGLPNDDQDRPKYFDFDTQGRSFITVESIRQILETADASGLLHDDRYLLGKMRDASSSPRNRVAFLEALAAVPDGCVWGTYRVETICDTITLWKGTPAVDRWCIEALPLAIVADFSYLARWLKEGQSVLHQLLKHTELDSAGRLETILKGVSREGERLSSRTLFAVAEEIARTLGMEESTTHLFWYARRLRDRIPARDQSLNYLSEAPDDTIQAVSRFLFALMSDIDTRIRWKSAHALRCLAGLGCHDIVRAAVSQSNRVKDEAFRDPNAPFYFLAAKLWLAIALYRISAEKPEALVPCKTAVLDLATFTDLPHVGIREYAKRALLQLASTGIITLLPSEYEQLNRVNIPLKGCVAEKKDHPRSFGYGDDDKHRFKFDQMDTTRYWYENILRFFPDVTMVQFLEIAERWILEKWGADPHANWWDKEPRKGRYEDRRYSLWSHDHGSLPTIERYGAHLEWHAMYCTVGELLTTYPVLKEDEHHFWDFEDWLLKVLPTEPPAWLSDNRGPTPLESRLWKEDPRTDNGWLRSVRRDEFLAEIGIYEPKSDGWIIVEAYYTARFPKREANISVNSALVSPETAHALVRALQTVSDPWDFKIPDEDDRLDIAAPPYYLVGWIAHSEGDTRFDAKDPFRYDVGQIRTKPGRKFAEAFGLVPKTDAPGSWMCKDSGETALFYEAWCDEPPPEDEYYPRRTRSNGWRLWVRTDLLRSFLAGEGKDLVVEVQIERQLRNEYGRSYETNTKTKRRDKILLLQADGSAAGVEGRIGTWTGVGKGTGA